VIVANGGKMKIIGSGSINLFSKEIPNVLHIEKCSSNLLSINKITQELNCEIIFSSKGVIFQDWITKNLIGEGFSKNGLSFFREQKLNLNAKKNEDLSNLWHKRIVYPSDKILKCIFYFKNLDCSNCEVCKLGKHTGLPFGVSNYKSKKPFDLIYYDVWGPAQIGYFNGYKYFIIFIDNFSRTTWLYLLKK
jgi:GAG-pre-integrase domain